jgi:ABC-type uncharacterized transport system substrate-binding protein
VLSPGSPPPADPFRQAENFEAGLRELGWQPGANITIKYRYAEGRLERLPAMAAELVALPVDVIVARGQTLAAARNATGSIPIVMAFDPDPIGNGYIQSLARPGGNITGLTTQAVELEAKWLALLGQAIPSLTRVGHLTKASSAASKTEQNMRREAAARTLRLEVVPVTVDKADQLPAVFATIKDTKVGAILVSQTLYFVDIKVVATLALEHRVASIGSQREFAEAGALMAYGANIAGLHRRVASYVDKILKGAKPANLPVEQPTRFEFVINARTAKALGLAIPLILLTFADEVIE